MTLEDARILAAYHSKHRPRSKAAQRLALCQMLLARATMQRHLPARRYNLFTHYFQIGEYVARGYVWIAKDSKQWWRKRRRLTSLQGSPFMIKDPPEPKPEDEEDTEEERKEREEKEERKD